MQAEGLGVDRKSLMQSLLADRVASVGHWFDSSTAYQCLRMTRDERERSDNVKAILSPELLQVLQDASNMQKVRRLLTASHGPHPAESIDVTVGGRKRRLTLSPVALSSSKLAPRG